MQRIIIHKNLVGIKLNVQLNKKPRYKTGLQLVLVNNLLFER